MISSNASVDNKQIRGAHGINAHFDKSLGLDALTEYLESCLPKPKPVPPKVLFIEASKTTATVISRIFKQNEIPYYGRQNK